MKGGGLFMFYVAMKLIIGTVSWLTVGPIGTVSW